MAYIVKVSQLDSEYPSLLSREQPTPETVAYFPETAPAEKKTPIWFAALEVIFSVLPISMILFSLAMIWISVSSPGIPIPSRTVMFFAGFLIVLFFFWGFVRWLRKEIVKTRQRFGLFLLSDALILRTEVSTAALVRRSALVSISRVPFSDGSWSVDISSVSGPAHFRINNFEGLKWEDLRVWSPERTLEPPEGWEAAVGYTRPA